MAVAFPYVRAATWADGSTTDTAAKRNTMEDGIFNAHQAPAARVFHNAAQSIANSTETTVAFNSERYDQAGGAASTQHDTVTNNSRLTCRFAGIYAIGASIGFTTGGTRTYAYIRLNGTTYLAGTDVAGGYTIMNIATQYSLAVNDYVEIRVLQTSGGAQNLISSANFSPEFWWARVG